MRGRAWVLDLKGGGWAWEDQRKKGGKQKMRASDGWLSRWGPWRGASQKVEPGGRVGVSTLQPP